MPPGTNRWNRGRKQTRTRNVRRLLILCEDTKSSRLYLKQFPFDRLKPKLQDALRHAARLAFENAEIGQPRRNPSTSVHELIKVLREHDPAKQMA